TSLDTLGFLHSPRPPGATPFPYTTLFRSTIARATDAGLTLGVHSATHRTLTELDDAELEREIFTSWETIRQRAGVRAECFAYPRSEEHTSELQSPDHLVCPPLLEKEQNHP